MPWLLAWVYGGLQLSKVRHVVSWDGLFFPYTLHETCASVQLLSKKQRCLMKLSQVLKRTMTCEILLEMTLVNWQLMKGLVFGP